jgi:four helix bundle protein
MDLMVEVRALTKRLPADERYELSSQLRRTALSIPANIAEGYGRVHRGDYVHHLSIARGSAAELETHLDACERLGHLTAADLAHARDLADHVGRLLTRMVIRLR